MSNLLFPKTDLTRLNKAEFERFAAFITDNLGIRMPSSKKSMLQSRLERRLRRLGIGLSEYQELLFDTGPDGDAERIHFFDAVTTNKTDFFREARHFDYLTEVALPELARISGEPRNWDFNLWCAGCSSGEEAYTLAMTLEEFAHTRSGFSWSILATDISTQVLEKARLGIYDFPRIEPVSLELRKKYIRRGKGENANLVRMIPRLREKLRFARLNFMEDQYEIHTEFDVIFFRNVMIYFDKSTQEKVINRLSRHLRPGGFLFVGHSESLTGTQVPVQQVSLAVYRKPL